MIPNVLEIREYRYVSPADVHPDDEQTERISERCAVAFGMMKAHLALDDIALARLVKDGVFVDASATKLRAVLRDQLDKYGPSAERTVAVARRIR